MDFAKITGRVELIRSFAYKMNVGNYESRDFFASAKAECETADMDEISSGLDGFVQDQVLASVKQYRRKLQTQKEKERK